MTSEARRGSHRACRLAMLGVSPRAAGRVRPQGVTRGTTDTRQSTLQRSTMTTGATCRNIVLQRGRAVLRRIAPCGGVRIASLVTRRTRHATHATIAIVPMTPGTRRPLRRLAERPMHRRLRPSRRVRIRRVTPRTADATEPALQVRPVTRRRARRCILLQCCRAVFRPDRPIGTMRIAGMTRPTTRSTPAFQIRPMARGTACGTEQRTLHEEPVLLRFAPIALVRKDALFGERKRRGLGNLVGG